MDLYRGWKSLSIFVIMIPFELKLNNRPEKNVIYRFHVVHRICQLSLPYGTLGVGKKDCVEAKVGLHVEFVLFEIQYKT